MDKVSIHICVHTTCSSCSTNRETAFGQISGGLDRSQCIIAQVHKQSIFITASLLHCCVTNTISCVSHPHLTHIHPPNLPSVTVQPHQPQLTCSSPNVQQPSRAAALTCCTASASCSSHHAGEQSHRRQIPTAGDSSTRLQRANLNNLPGGTLGARAAYAGSSRAIALHPMSVR